MHTLAIMAVVPSMERNQLRRRESDVTPSRMELEQLCNEALDSLHRILVALIEAVETRDLVHPSEESHVRFLAQLMFEFFNEDLASHLLRKDAGWSTIHRFFSHCKKAHPRWASKDTFYKRMNTCLPYLLSETIIEQRPARKRLGISRARFEFRINADHPYAKGLMNTAHNAFEDLSRH